MRLLECQYDGTFRFIDRFFGNRVPPYAILSHTWGDERDEVLYEDMIAQSGSEKQGYRKIKFCGEQAAKDGLRYFWVNSCCINKPNMTELSEAIVSMFRWYQEATVCYVYLADVSISAGNTHDPDLETCLSNKQVVHERMDVTGATCNSISRIFLSRGRASRKQAIAGAQDP
ncbi:heterokaryon incompatibility protein-domain-containing protein [Xylariaceae sp. AK1471]|nr:heterokaryon incompatibility protein-domain-containing protein [Xylariaceae sp. AK1471]